MEDAEFYQRHKDDAEEWGEPIRKPERRRLAAMVSVRLTPEEEVLVRTAAEQVGESLSNFVRRAALAAAVPRSVMSLTSPSTVMQGSGLRYEATLGSFEIVGRSEIAEHPNNVGTANS